MKSVVRFPLKFTQGGACVKVYEIKHERTKKGRVYSVAWYEIGGKRKQKQFTDLEKAKAEARLKLDQLSAGKVEAAQADRSDLEELYQARKLAAGAPLVAAMEEYRAAKDLCPDLLSAARHWKERNAPSFKRITVAEAIDLFLAAKDKQGVDTNASYRKVLPSLKDSNIGGMSIESVSSRRLQEYLDKFGNAVTRNTVRKRIVTVWRWARKSGYLPRDVQTEAERTESAREDAPEVGIISAEIFQALLRYIEKNHRHYIPQLALAGYCGLRRTEIHGQRWEDISLERKFVRVSKAKRGTPARRIVPLCDAAVEWLKPFQQPAGEVSEGNTWAIDRIRDIGRTNGFELPENCFRHTYISARVAATGDVNHTSLEAGNSTRIIFRHYRELMTKEEGLEWFGEKEQQPADAKGAANG